MKGPGSKIKFRNTITIINHRIKHPAPNFLASGFAANRFECVPCLSLASGICLVLVLASVFYSQTLIAQGFVVPSVGNTNNSSQVSVPNPTSQLAEGATSDLNEPLLEKGVEQHLVLGQNLFGGKFGSQKFAGFNPNYRVAVGDKLLIQIWGAVESTGEQVVDAQGNIFIPQVGPVQVAGTLNSQLNQLVRKSISRIYKKDVHVYASLQTSQPVRVFVTGNVIRPGLYSGLASESILAYLDRAGGIDPLRGSYLDIALKRNNQMVESFNLYNFLLKGELPLRQLYEGDVIVVRSRQSVINFTGLVENPFQVEFRATEVNLHEALQIVQPLPNATHIAVERNQGLVKQVEYHDIKNALNSGLVLYAGDSVSVVSDKSRGSIGILVEGEHLGRAQYVLPYGAKLSDLLPLIQPSELSKLDAVQLFRVSLAQKQRDAVMTTLDALQSQVLSARSDTVEEANLRVQESNLILKFIERAKQVQPKGQVVLGAGYDANDVLLENGDKIIIPSKSNLVTVDGEVLFPSAVLFKSKFDAKDYIKRAGGFTQGSRKSRIIVRKPSGDVRQIGGRGGVRESSFSIEPGDEILVLPNVDTKSLQFAKDIFQVVYQLALSAGVVLSID